LVLDSKSANLAFILVSISALHYCVGYSKSANFCVILDSN